MRARTSHSPASRVPSANTPKSTTTFRCWNPMNSAQPMLMPDRTEAVSRSSENPPLTQRIQPRYASTPTIAPANVAAS